MPYTPPNKIIINSDGNILEFQQTIKTKTELKYEYIYTKSFTLLGRLILFSEDEIERYLRKDIFKIITDAGY